MTSTTLAHGTTIASENDRPTRIEARCDTTVLEAVWDEGPDGATRAQIWERISERRSVVRTTIVNLVDRLEARGWLERDESGGSLVFRPTLPREEVEAEVADDFLKSFFGGSASHLIMSLFGREKVSSDEVQRIKELVQQKSKVDAQKTNKKGKKK